MYWGYHLILDCKAGDLDKIKSGDNITDFVMALVTGINMVAYGDPIVEHFATHIPEAAGYSLVQLIETSSITGHFVDKNGDCYIDIFSCKEFDVDDAKSIVQDYFNPTQMRVTYLTRQA
jgi:S-adenosylmethionine/arginine decarboxylase-like enzyme